MTDVTFTRTTRTVADDGSGSSVSTTTIAASAVKVRANAREEQRFRDLSLAVERTLVLLVTTSSYGDAIALNDTVVWPQGGTDYAWTVRYVDEVAPDGFAIISRVVISR